MKNKKRNVLIVLGILIILGIIGGSYAWSEYNRTVESIKTKKATYSMMSSDLIAEFSQDEKSATNKYMDEILELKGTVKSIEVKNERTIIQLQSASPLSGVSVEFEKEQDLSGYDVGDPIHFKALLSGYMMGAVMVSGVIIN